MNDIKDWWDNSEFDFFKSLHNDDKLGYIYDLYSEGITSQFNLVDEEDNPIPMEDLEDYAIDESLFKDNVSKPTERVSIIEGEDSLTVISSNKNIIDSMIKRIFMDGVILSLEEETEQKDGDSDTTMYKKVYKIVGVGNMISVN